MIAYRDRKIKAVKMSDIDRRRYRFEIEDPSSLYTYGESPEGLTADPAIDGEDYYHKSAVLELLTMLRLEHDHRRKTYGRVSDAGECDVCAVIAHYKRQFNE